MPSAAVSASLTFRYSGLTMPDPISTEIQCRKVASPSVYVLAYIVQLQQQSVRSISYKLAKSGEHRELLRTLEEFLCSLLPLIRRRSAEISEIRGAIHIPASNPREKFDRNRQSSSLNEAEICEIFTQPRQKSLLTDGTTALHLSRE